MSQCNISTHISFYIYTNKERQGTLEKIKGKTPLTKKNKTHIVFLNIVNHLYNPQLRLECFLLFIFVIISNLIKESNKYSIVIWLQ